MTDKENGIFLISLDQYKFSIAHVCTVSIDLCSMSVHYENPSAINIEDCVDSLIQGATYGNGNRAAGQQYGVPIAVTPFRSARCCLTRSLREREHNQKRRLKSCVLRLPESNER